MIPRSSHSRRAILATSVLTTAMLVAPIAAQRADAAADSRTGSPTMSNFDPSVNGFQFPNYATGSGTVPLQYWTSADEYRLMGPHGCENTGATADNCVVSQLVLSLTQQGMDSGQSIDGQCFGMAMLSQLLFNGYTTPPQIDPSYTTSETTYAFPNSATPVSSKLQHEIYFWWASQMAMSVPYTPPTSAYAILQQAFANDPNHIGYVISLSDHAITPVGVSPTSSEPGYASIKVYDNNHPGEIRDLFVNLTTNRFGYDGGGFNLYGGTNGGANTGPGQIGFLSLTPINSLPTFACEDVGFCYIPGKSAKLTSVAVGTTAKSQDKGISLKVLGADGRTVKGLRQHYTSQTHAQALAQVPLREREFTLVIKDRGSRHAQVLNLGAFAGSNSASAQQVILPKRGTVQVRVDRRDGTLRVLGARNVDFDGVADLGRYDYRVRFDVADRARAGGAGTADMGRTKGVATYRSMSATEQIVRVATTRSQATKDGRVVRDTVRRTLRVAAGQAIRVHYSAWKAGRSLEID